MRIHIDEADVIPIRHRYIDIIVPGYEAFMPHRPQKGATEQIIGQVVFLAEIIELAKDIEKLLFDFLQIAIVEFNDWFDRLLHFGLSLL